MKLQDILNHKGSRVCAVSENQTIRQALDILIQEQIGAVLVLSHTQDMVGILSERDIIQGGQRSMFFLETQRVSSLMSQPVISAGPEDEVEHVMALMTEHRIRHVPVVSDGKLCGIVSIGDVVKALLQESAYEVRSLKEFIYGSSVV